MIYRINPYDIINEKMLTKFGTERCFIGIKNVNGMEIWPYKILTWIWETTCNTNYECLSSSVLAGVIGEDILGNTKMFDLQDMLDPDFGMYEWEPNEELE